MPCPICGFDNFNLKQECPRCIHLKKHSPLAPALVMAPVVPPVGMIFCPACALSISTKAYTCPACGHPIRRAYLFSKSLIGVGVVLVLGLLYFAASRITQSEIKREQPTIDLQREYDYKSTAGIGRNTSLEKYERVIAKAEGELEAYKVKWGWETNLPFLSDRYGSGIDLRTKALYQAGSKLERFKAYQTIKNYGRPSDFPELREFSGE